MLPRTFFGLFIGFSAFILPSFTTRTGHGVDSMDSLMAKLLQEPIHQPEVYTRAVQILESIESAPSCHRLAAVSLIDSCQVLESSTTSEISLASVRETYATRLAMCELSSAGNLVPAQCERFIPTIAACNQETSTIKRLWSPRSQSVDSKGFETTCYPTFTPSNTKQCINSLSTRPQWWTSYSNALQNVLIVCQAGRDAVEKESILRTFRETSRIHSDLTAAHANSLKRAVEFNIVLEKMKAQVLDDMTSQVEKSKTVFAQVIIDFHRAYHSALTIFNSGVDASAAKLKHMNEDIVAGHAQVLQANAAVETLHSNVLSRNSDIEIHQINSLEKLSDRAIRLDEHMAHLINNKMASIHEVIALYSTQLANFTDKLTASNIEVERHIVSNTENLERQAEAIAKVKASSDDYTYLFLGFTICFTLFANVPWPFKLFLFSMFLAFTLLKVLGIASVVGPAILWSLSGMMPPMIRQHVLIVMLISGVFYLIALYGVLRLHAKHNIRQSRHQLNMLPLSEKKDNHSCASMKDMQDAEAHPFYVEQGS